MSPDDAGLPPPGARACAVTTWRQGEARPAQDWVAEEVPVALVVNGLSHAVMMASPADLEDFALGFGFTEGLLAGPEALYGVEVEPGPLGIELQMTVSSASFQRLKERRRTLAGRTGCGLCGTDSLGQVCQSLAAVPPVQVALPSLARAQAELRQRQLLQHRTGATHAAAWCQLDGQVSLVREDVGRHNALDKLIGALLRQGSPRNTGFALITSRASFEMVQKSALAGIGLLAAVSAPTQMAIDTAQACGLCLAGFVRGPDLVAYTFPERLGLPAAAADSPQAPPL